MIVLLVEVEFEMIEGVGARFALSAKINAVLITLGPIPKLKATFQVRKKEWRTRVSISVPLAC